MAGAQLTVHGTLPSGAKGVSLTFEVARERSARPKASPGETLHERYARANDKVVLTRLVPRGAQGRFAERIRLPRDLRPGTYWVKAYAEMGKRCAVGALKVVIPAR